MNHPMHRVASFAIVGPHELEVGFEDGVVRRINFLPVLEGELFGPLKDLDVFNSVTISPEGYTLLWPNGADFDPATLHDWPEVEARPGHQFGPAADSRLDGTGPFRVLSCPC